MVLTLLLVLFVVHILAEFYLLPLLCQRASPVVVISLFLLVATFAALTFLGFSLLMSLAASGALTLQFTAFHVLLTKTAVTLKGMLFKQGIHLFFISVLAWLVSDNNAQQNALATLSALDVQQVLCWLVAYLLALKPASALISLLLQNWTKELTEDQKENPNRPLTDAGTYIGYLERTLIVTFVLWGQLPGVALVLAAKSVFRFGDLKDHGSRMFTEYVMLGTFASTLAGIASGLVGSYLGQI